MPAPRPALINRLLSTVIYKGSPKHKIHPHLFGLPPYNGVRGDETLCDAHAGFTPQEIDTIPALIKRGLRAGLIGEGGLIWIVADGGWIFEGRVTNIQQTEYHGYPVLPSKAIGESVYRRFTLWAQGHGTLHDRKAARHCKALHGFKR